MMGAAQPLRKREGVERYLAKTGLPNGPRVF
jgi:hypothetical protein